MTASWQQFLLSRGARFGEGRVESFGGAPAVSAGPNLVDLSHCGVIEVHGADAAAFLHAQLTNDVLALPDGHAQRSGWCTPKGRLLATLLVWREGDRYFLLLPRALQQAIQKRLQMFVLRSKVTLRDASGDRVAMGLAFGNADAAPLMALTVEKDHAALRLSPQRTLLLCDPATAAAQWEQRVRDGAAESGAAAWRLAAIAEGVYELAAETQEQFVPQMVNFDLTRAVSFTKGCYPGQEIVARTQYRGILKRRMVRVECAAPLKPAEAVFAPEFGDQPAGQVADAVIRPDGVCEALVVAQIDSIRAGSLHAQGGAPLKVLPLPYPVPEIVTA